MSVGYRAVGWNRFKLRHDAWLAAGLVLYVALFVGVTGALHPDATLETALIRAFGSGAILLLHVILAIGPLCRLDSRFLPLLYNRRHLGVSMFCLALLHGGFALFQYHGFGDVNPFVSLLTADGDWSRLSDFPFQPFGAAALLILFLMAATSHDFWLHNLSAPVWKALHMLVYVAWALLLAHVGFGVVRDEVSPGGPIAMLAGAAALLVLHRLAARREARTDRAAPAAAADGWLDACAVDEIPEGRARVVVAGGERVAIFRWDGQVAALSSVCQHQNGPLGEGRILDGCVTCPWHGYQYLPATGRSPPPFSERVPTFRVGVRNGRVLLDPRPCPAGTPQTPARCVGTGPAPRDDAGFFIGYLAHVPPRLAARLRASVAVLLLLAVAVAIAVAAGQGPFKPATFEYGVERTFEGTVVERPLPTLLLDRPQAAGSEAPAQSRWLLAAPWKHGAQELVAGLDGRRVVATGVLVHREGQTMIELAGRPREQPGAGASPEPVALGEVELRGQIVDSKCWLGVMNPADTVTHRACAVRCLSGGIPPLFVARAQDGGAVSLLLVGRDGRALNGEILDLVAEPLIVRGAVERQGAQLVLLAEPQDFRRE